LARAVHDTAAPMVDEHFEETLKNRHLPERLM